MRLGFLSHLCIICRFRGYALVNFWDGKEGNQFKQGGRFSVRSARGSGSSGAPETDPFGPTGGPFGRPFTHAADEAHSGRGWSPKEARNGRCSHHKGRSSEFPATAAQACKEIEWAAAVAHTCWNHRPGHPDCDHCFRDVQRKERPLFLRRACRAAADPAASTHEAGCGAPDEGMDGAAWRERYGQAAPRKDAWPGPNQHQQWPVDGARQGIFSFPPTLTAFTRLLRTLGVESFRSL